MLVWGVLYAAPDVKACRCSGAPVLSGAGELARVRDDGGRVVHYGGHSLLVLCVLAARRRAEPAHVVPVR